MLYYILAAGLVVIDQLVKFWVRGNIPLGDSIPFLPHILDLAYVQNTGAAFSSFAGMTWMLSIVSLLASVVIMVLLARNVFTGRWGRLCLTLILAGALGNLIDRVILGFVTDMFMTTFIDFAVFNVADICVVIGGIMMVIYVLFFWDKEKKR